MGTKSTGSRFGGMFKDRLVKAGRIGKLFGTDGGLTLNLYDRFPDEHNTEEPLWVIIDSLAVPLFTERLERRGRRGALVRFADIDTTQRAEELVGLYVYLPDEAGECSDGELYFEDLEGYTALIREEDSQKVLRGVVSTYVDSDFNPMFEVEVSGAGVLIPASEDFIENVDPEKREISFTLPEGLLGLNE